MLAVLWAKRKVGCWLTNWGAVAKSRWRMAVS